MLGNNDGRAYGRVRPKDAAHAQKDRFIPPDGRARRLGTGAGAVGATARVGARHRVAAVPRRRATSAEQRSAGTGRTAGKNERNRIVSHARPGPVEPDGAQLSRHHWKFILGTA